ncbi:hypothetical protein SVAN01_07080 [Stagonosporopsis vannaccii]|nr:hypothetical protein SVAN01_07080 [Stagonosporopsis vannaccii]
MPSRVPVSLLALAALPFLADARDSSHCDAVADHLNPNATASLNIAALQLNFLGSGGDDFSITNESDFSWRLSSSIQPIPAQLSDDQQSDRTQTVVWLDTDASNTTRLGDHMRMCHNFIPLQIGRNVTWGHGTLEKSVQDTGDCRTLVSETCRRRLTAQYAGQAALERSRYTGCTRGNFTVPWECAESGMVEPISRPNPEFNTTLASRIPLLTNATAATIPQNESLVCHGHNFSRSFGTLASQQDYDLGTNFPLMDIMTFFGAMPPGRIYSPRMAKVQIACLVPGQVAEGSREKASVESVLERYNSTGGNQTAEDWKADDESTAVRVFGRGVEWWTLVAGILVVAVTSAV